jgi:methanogenic corrinoid protein MtbC1
MDVPELASQLFSSQQLRTNLVAGNTDVLVPNMKSSAMEGNLMECLGILRAGLASKPDLIALFHEVVFPVLTSIGDDWASGELSIDAEHLATHTIRDAIIRLQSSVHMDPFNGRTALLACYEGQLHDIVLSCASIYLQSRGWRVFNLGQSTPAESIVRAITSHKPQLVIVSVFQLDQERKFLIAMNKKIAPASHRLGAKLVVGGPQLRSRFAHRLQADLVSDSLLDLKEIAAPDQYIVRSQQRSNSLASSSTRNAQ